MSPILSSFGGLSNRGYYKPTPVVTGGTLTSDATYYYRTFTNTSTTGATTDTLSITNGSLDFDYVLVGGGGSLSSSFKLNAQFTVSRYNDAFTAYLGNGKTNVGTVRAGGAGGVLNGSLSLNPNSYTISIGSAGSGDQKGFNSSAFNGALVAKGGGSGDVTADGGPNTSGNSSNTVGSGGSVTTAWNAFGQQYGTPGQGNDTGAYGSPTTAFAASLFSIVTFNRGSTYSSLSNSCSSISNNGWFSRVNNSTADIWCIQSWHGAGGASASGRGTDSTGYATIYFPPNFSATVGGGFETNSTWGGNPTSAGAGVTHLGLTVGQAGDLPHLTRTTALTPANTGCGKGATHAAGSGVLRIRYLRSAVGG
jgi:hypothetical protein